MRRLLFILMVIPLILAVSPEEFLQPYLKPSEYVYYEEVNLSDRAYYLVWVNATKTFVLKRVAEGFLIANSSSEIAEVLQTRFLNSFDMESPADNVLSNLRTFNTTRMVRQTDCERLTGTDHMPCYDQDSCLQACLSVPSCRNYNQGTGGKLVDAILEWREEDRKIEGNLSLCFRELQEARGKDANIRVHVSSARYALMALFHPMEEIGDNKLFKSCPDCFMYCEPMVFDNETINESIRILEHTLQQLEYLDQLPDEVGEIMDETTERIRMREYQDFVESAEEREENISRRIERLRNFVNDSILESRYSKFRELFSKIEEYGGYENYSAALSLKDEFFDKAAEVEERLSEIEMAYVRYMMMMDGVDEREENLTRDVDYWLERVNDSFLIEHLEKLRNIKEEMKEYGREANFSGAYELEDDFNWEAMLLEERMSNVSSSYATVTIMLSNLSSSFQNVGADVNNFTDLYEDYVELEQTFNESMEALEKKPTYDELKEIEEELKVVIPRMKTFKERLDERMREKKEEELKVFIRELFIIFWRSIAIPFKTSQ